MDNEISISEELKALIEIYGLTAETLARYLSLTEEQVLLLAGGNTHFLSPEPIYRFQLFNKISFLFLSAVDDNDKTLRSFLRTLLSRHHLSKQSIAAMSGISIREIENFLSDSPDRISDQTRYHIAATVMSLRFFLKDATTD